MADAVDMAGDLVAEHLARSIAAARVAVAAGAAGDCVSCGEHFARLVDGRCGFCRDGRRRPGAALARALLPPAARADFEREEAPMPKTPPPPPPDKVQVNITIVPGPVLTAIQRRACGGPLGPAARDLLAELLAGAAEPGPAAVALEDMHLDALLGELRRRFTAAGDPAALLTERARADAAEAKLASLRAALAA